MARLRKPGRSLFSLFLGLAPILALALFQAPAHAEARPVPEDRSPSQPDIDITVDDVVAAGFSLPIQVSHAGDGSGRLFVVEQTGKIRIIDQGAILATPYLDLGASINCCGEQGLLGLAFHPNYETNGYVYVNYSRKGDGATVIARYQVSNTNANIANPNSAYILLIVPQPYGNHNGGQVLFGPDGYLYIGMGDGGSGGDPLDHGQNINTLLGAMLRLDVDSGAPYAIPPSNPYVGRSGLDEIWTIGLRNPWRFSFDRATGDLYIGDVGQNAWEEIDYQAAEAPGGLNFGWRCKEGTHLYNYTGGCFTAQLTDPIVDYSHSVGRSVTGGFVYRGLLYPNLAGRYFYGDYVDGKIWSLYKTGTNPDTWSTPELELATGFNISAFGEDENGELYVADYVGGNIRQLADVNGPVPNLSTSDKKVSTPSADPLEVVTYTIHLINTASILDASLLLTDTIPAGLEYVPNSLSASHGAWDDTSAPTLTWEGNLNASTNITIAYQVTVSGAVTGSIVNQASVYAPLFDTSLTLMEALAVPRSVLTTTVQDFTFPGTQPGGLTTGLVSSVDCDICHSEPIYDRWRGSMMSQAGRDPLMWAALYTANIDAPDAGEYCLRCHTPKGWLSSRSHPPNGSALEDSDIANGVTCSLCHRSVDPLPSTLDEAAAIDQAIRGALSIPVPIDFVGSGAVIVDPHDNRRGPFSFGLSLPYHAAYQTDFLRQTGDAVTRARMCGTCHNVYNPALSWDPARGQFWPNQMDAPAPDFDGEALFPIETTFDEWLYSDFARGGVYSPQFAGSKPDGIVRTCQDCHMTRATGTAADPAFNPIERDCRTSGCLPEHIFAGGNSWVPQLLQNPDWRLNALGDSANLDKASLYASSMLRKSATLTVTLTTSGTEKIAAVHVTNHSGHKLPTGYPEGRQMWLNLQAYDADDQLISESGAYDPVSGQLTRDENIKVYESKQGITPQLASILPQSAGASFHFVLNNTVEKDNRIPPQGYTQALYDKPGLRPVGVVYADGQNWDETVYSLPLETERLVVTLYYQTASKEYIEFLRANGGVDGLALHGLWQENKSPPKIIAQVYYPSFDAYLPLILKVAQTSMLATLSSALAEFGSRLRAFASLIFIGGMGAAWILYRWR